MSKVFCSECGSEIIGPSKFCPTCGHPITAVARDQSHQQPAQQEHTQPTPPENSAHGVKPNNNFMVVFIIAGIIGIGLLIFFWQKEAPEDVAEQFFNHIMNLEIKEAEKLVSSDADPSVREEMRELGDMLDDMPIEFKTEQLGMKNKFKVVDVDISGKKATVEAEISIINEEFTEEAYFELKKEKGNWKILYVD